MTRAARGRSAWAAVLGLAAGLLAVALPAPASASAPSPSYAETRVRGSNLEIAAGVGAERALSPTRTKAYATRYDELAAGYPLVPRAATRASVDDKLARYLLNPEHPVGGPKAKWFEEALGFTRRNADELAEQIVFDPTRAVQTEVTRYGTMFEQTISITGANGRTIEVPFAWIRNNDGVVRLVTGVPVKKP